MRVWGKTNGNYLSNLQLIGKGILLTSLFLLWKKVELELKRFNTKSKQTASNDNTPFEEGEDIVGPLNVLSPIVEGNEDTAITGPSHVLSPIVEGNEDTAIAGQSKIPSL